MDFNFDEPPQEVTLPGETLIRVLTQVRYSSTPELVQPEEERAIAALLPQLPIRGHARSVVVESPPAPAVVDDMRTFDSLEPGNRATVSSHFVAYETTRYETRPAFLHEVRSVLRALANVRSPARITRIGIRYTNVFTDLDHLDDWFEPEILGMMRRGQRIWPATQVMQAIFTHSDGRAVMIRSAFVPPNEVVEPGLTPAPEPSWLIDIDAYEESPRPGFDVDHTVESLETLSKAAYSMFVAACKGYVDEKGVVRHAS